MKRAILFAMALVAAAAAAAPGDVRIQRKPLSGASGYEDVVLTEPAAASVLSYDVATRSPLFVPSASFVGAVGPAGPSGANGLQGSPGPAGAAGQQGIQGLPGAPGDASTVPGPVGPIGATGATGPAGPSIVVSQASAVRTLNTAYQVNAARGALVIYSVQITVTASIAGGQNGEVVLEIASNSAFTNNVQTLSVMGNGQVYTLAVAIQGVAPATATVVGVVPAGYYVRLRTVNNTGTPTFLFRAGQEILI